MTTVSAVIHEVNCLNYVPKAPGLISGLIFTEDLK